MPKRCIAALENHSAQLSDERKIPDSSIGDRAIKKYGTIPDSDRSSSTVALVLQVKKIIPELSLGINNIPENFPWHFPYLVGDMRFTQQTDTETAQKIEP